jgi:uncharacterized protein with HEPN domain
MKTPLRKLLSDIEKATNHILAKTNGKTEADYTADRDLQLIVERLFTILGEAATRIRRHYPTEATLLKHLNGPIAFRNFLIHVYDQISDPHVWRIIVEELPPLKAEIEAAISKLDQPPSP